MDERETDMYSLLKSAEKLLLLQQASGWTSAQDRTAAVAKFYVGSEDLVRECLIDAIVELQIEEPGELSNPCAGLRTAMVLRSGTGFNEQYGIFAHAAACSHLGASILGKWVQVCRAAAIEDLEEIENEIALLEEREADGHADDLATDALMDREIA
jgi:hypothetical protein